MSTTNLPALRVGEGWDTHALVVGRPLVLGGVTIAHSHGLLGHSDADACCTPSPTRCWAGPGWATSAATSRTRRSSSRAPIRTACSPRPCAACGGGWQVVNVDCTIVAQAPKMAPHVPAMVARIAEALGIEPARVNVKAKTAEKMGPVGEGRAIETRAVCLLAALS
jgi:2-C-methyl-D-erythritol 2,4-cyclodiphosphate synthase